MIACRKCNISYYSIIRRIVFVDKLLVILLRKFIYIFIPQNIIV